MSQIPWKFESFFPKYTILGKQFVTFWHKLRGGGIIWPSVFWNSAKVIPKIWSFVVVIQKISSFARVMANILSFATIMPKIFNLVKFGLV